MSSKNLEVSPASIDNRGRSRVKAISIHPISGAAVTDTQTVGFQLSIAEARKMALGLLLLTESSDQTDSNGYIRITGNRKIKSISLLARRKKSNPNKQEMCHASIPTAGCP